jgi:bacterial/archaeal transporter family protein
MGVWFWYAVAAAVLYGLHQVFTKLASSQIDSTSGALVVEVTAAVAILLFAGYQKVGGKLAVAGSQAGVAYSVLTGVCVGAGTILFFVLFQKGGPLSAVPAILAGGAALMAVIGFVVLREPIYWQKVLGVILAIAAMGLLHYGPKH